VADPCYRCVYPRLFAVEIAALRPLPIARQVSDVMDVWGLSRHLLWLEVLGGRHGWGLFVRRLGLSFPGFPESRGRVVDFPVNSLAGSLSTPMSGIDA